MLSSASDLFKGNRKIQIHFEILSCLLYYRSHSRGYGRYIFTGLCLLTGGGVDDKVGTHRPCPSSQPFPSYLTPLPNPPTLSLPCHHPCHTPSLPCTIHTPSPEDLAPTPPHPLPPTRTVGL